MLIHIKQKHQPKQTMDVEKANCMLDKGELNGDEPAWIAGLQEWTTLYNIPGIKVPEPPPYPDPTDVSKADCSTPNPTKSIKEYKELKGVGGWLLFFCVCLTILGPFFSLGSALTNWEAAEKAFLVFPSIKTAAIVENVWISFIVLIGFFIGINIWTRENNGKSFAQFYLKLRLVSFIIVEFLALLILIRLPPKIFTSAVESIVGGIIYESAFFSIWWFYFKKSKRVKNTYLSIAKA